MSDFQDFKTENLVKVRQILTNEIETPWDRLCRAACYFLATALDIELAERGGKAGKGKGK